MAVLGEDDFRNSNLSDFYASFKQGALDAAGVTVVSNNNPVREGSKQEIPLTNKKEDQKKKKGGKKWNNKKRNVSEFFEEEIGFEDTEIELGSKKAIERKLTEKEIALVKELTPVVSVEKIEKIEKTTDVESEEYKNASVDIYRTLLMLGDVPFLDGFLVRGKDLDKTRMLDFCVNTLVKNGVDIEMRLSVIMTGENEELKKEIRSKILDLRAFVLGVDKIIDPKTKKWLEEIGVNEVRLNSIKDSVGEKYAELFEEEEEYFQRNNREELSENETEHNIDIQPFYNPIDDLIVAYDLAESENGFIRLGEIKEESTEKEEARKRLVENEYNLSVVEDNDLEYKRKLAARIAEEIKTLLNIYVESWVRSNTILSKFMGVNAERLGSEKVGEQKKMLELGEVAFYDQIFEDLYLSVLIGDVDGKQEAIDRLREHGIKPKQYNKNSEKDRLKYLDVLQKIKDGEENKRQLEWQIIISHKLNNVEDFKKKYADLANAAGEDVKKEKTNMYPEVFDDLWIVENGSEEEKKIAFERLMKKGIKVKVFLNDESNQKLDYQYALECIKNNNFRSWRGGETEAKKRIKDILGIEENVESLVNVVKEEAVNKESIWNQDTYNDLYTGGWNTEDAKSVDARNRLLKKGIDLDIAFKDKENQDKIAKAITIAHFTKPVDGISVEKARQILKDYFGTVDGEIENVEAVNIVGLEPISKEADKKKELVWTKRIAELISQRDGPKNVWLELHRLNYYMKPSKDQDGEVWMAAGVVASNVGDVASAEKFLKDYFRVSDGGNFQEWEELDKKYLEENKHNIQIEGDETDQTSEKEPAIKEMFIDEDELFKEFGDFVEKNGGRLDVWNDWMKRMKSVSDGDRISAVRQLKYTWDLLNDIDMRLDDEHFQFWQKYGLAYMRALGVADKV